MNQIQQSIQQLKSPDPVARRNAVIALGKSANKAAIPALTQVSESDPEPALREFAQKAILHINKAQSPSEQTIDAALAPITLSGVSNHIEEPSDAMIGLPPVASVPEIVLPTGPSGPPPGEPSAREKLLAKGNLEHALGQRVSGDNEKAFILLTEALRIDPALAKETTAMNLASVLLNKPPKEAVQIVLQRSQDERTRPQEGVGSGVRSLRVDKQVWDFVLEAAILLVVLILFSVVLNFGVIRAMNSLLTSLRLPSQLSADRAAQVQQEADQLRAEINAQTPVALFLESLKTGALLLFVTLLGNSIIFGVGTLIGGTGLVFRFLGTMVRLQIVTYIVIGLALLFALYVDLQPTGAGGSSSVFVLIGLSVTGVAWFVSFVAQIYLAGRAHNMGIARGFLSVIVGNVISSVLIAILGILR